MFPVDKVLFFMEPLSRLLMYRKNHQLFQISKSKKYSMLSFISRRMTFDLICSCDIYPIKRAVEVCFEILVLHPTLHKASS